MSSYKFWVCYKDQKFIKPLFGDSEFIKTLISGDYQQIGNIVIASCHKLPDDTPNINKKYLTRLLKEGGCKKIDRFGDFTGNYLIFKIKKWETI